MQFIPTAIPDVILVKPDVFGDERGFFMETWQRRKFAEGGIDHDFVQDNHSRSVKGTLRGLHYQIRQPQGKLVRVTAGSVFDVAVDLRRGSPTFGQWAGEHLSADNHHMLWVPPGFAHGFYVTSETADFQYKCSDYYAPEHEHCIRWDDPELGIDWPLSDNGAPLVSEKDRQGLAFAQAEYFD
ncbi:dTDP-4-dehydrorhamnose 3,5-epimerase [Alkalilimnicola ehrlichii MLHE-1]|uniref:dTDP-4-dehydrorhamnose 3,5-epimerase n=1 Tax=Alkalilimnicola ehrlichii (strain ATCC BAA-1101 / DSM 17681 / MLHE-1) TaxID=187272 RepID=Q0A677_ALKEH|nr:dTDP-4-dehydrorhamnose 3,5-epimerase [Alkalilimnicola ehrlichii]ABI57660.1 dTDP-4-dehydrorhamnose 3,5-epimerase [Alkalilimnicola ehrlichii MLHE-1]